MYVARIGSTSPSSCNSSTDGPLVFSLALDDGSINVPAPAVSREKTTENAASHVRSRDPSLLNCSADLTLHLRPASSRAPWNSASDPATALLPRSWAPASMLSPPRPGPNRFFSAPDKFSPASCALPRSPARPAKLAIPLQRRPFCHGGARFRPNRDAPRHSRARRPGPREILSRPRPCSLRKVLAFPCGCARRECRSRRRKPHSQECPPAPRGGRSYPALI